MELKVDAYTKVIKNRTVLDHVSLTMTGGKIYGIKGENGSGKTMLMRAMIGLIRPTEGTVLINGEDLWKRESTGIGMLLENPDFKKYYTGYMNLKLLSDLRLHLSREELQDVLGSVGLDPEDKRLVGAYSLGMRQKLGIAAAIMGEPELIFLDEPFNALDENGVCKVRERLGQLRDEKRIILLSCHDREALEGLADHVYELRNGRLVGEYDVEV